MPKRVVPRPLPVGRALIADPELPRKVSEGRLEEIVSCTFCGACTDAELAAEGSTCTVNPAFGHEREARLRRLSSLKVSEALPRMGGFRAPTGRE